MQKQDTNSYRLSPQQEYLWSLQQLDQSDSYHVRCAVQIEGLLDVEILRAALASVVSRHEILRTAFHKWPGTSTLLQTINDSVSFSFLQLDLTDLNPQEQRAKIDDLFSKPSRLPVDLAEPPFLLVSLMVLSPTKHTLIIDLPALCADSTTLKNLLREINSSYEASLQGTTSSAASLQYVDVAEWQNQLLESDEATAHRDYWRRPDIAAHLNVKLPYENPPLAAASFSPRNLVEVVSPETVLKADSIALQSGVTLSDVLLACWQVLLWRLTGQSEMTIGTALEDRHYSELENVLGPLAQYLPLHTRLEEDLKFRDVLDQVSTSMHRLFKRREYFTWEDVRQSHADATHPPFPFVTFDFEEDSCQYANAAVCFSICRQYTCLGRFKLRLLGVRDGPSLSVEFHYDPNLFRSAEIKRLGRQFMTLLESVCTRPDTAVSALEILDDDERQRLLVELNQTESDYPQDKFVHELFEEQVKRTPQNIAVVFEEQHLTYAELNARANRLAQQLRTLGTTPEMLVGICVQPSPEMLVAILGVLKAGGAYVPLDPSYPSERLVLMLEDAQLSILLTQSHLLANLPEHEAKTICLDGDWEASASLDANSAVSEVTPDNPAYVIYTSGSTGRPKGVVITHRGLVNYLSWCTRVYPLTSGEGAFVHSSIGFDLTVTSIFVPLLTGQKIFLARGDQGVESLNEALCGGVNFSFLKLTPSHLEVLGQLLPAEAAPRVGALIIGGEALSTESLSFWREHASESRIFNEYGPTEAVVGCCVYEVPAKLPIAGAVPIGRPIANTQLYILDSRQQPVPFGVSGELYIGGNGVARCYLNLPEQTAEKFVPNPFSDQAGGRLYKTGDLARYLPGGDIEFIGRTDSQVKVRGYRIELGEIETRIKAHPSVLDSVVIVREDVPGDRRIVAYVVSVPGSPAPAAHLPGFLGTKLPDYMLPASYVKLKHLPLTAHGKVDRLALPPPSQSRPDIDKTYIAPRTEVEISLAQIWSQVLGLEQIGIDDNFFQLGGHSLLATQLISRLRNVLQVELSLRKLFDSPTIASQAEEVERLMQAGVEIDSPPLIRVARTGNIPLSYGQQRLWFLDRLEPDSAAYNIPAAVRLTGKLNLEVLERSLNEIVRRHEALRTTFATIEGEPVQVIAPALILRPPLVDLAQLPDREAEALRLATAEAQQPFALDVGPLLRITMLRLRAEEHVVLLTMHHIISDGWSMEVFVKEFATLYEDYNAGRLSSLPELAIQYGDYAVWQREWFRGEALKRQVEFWKRQLAGALFVLDLPLDHARPAVQTFRGATRGFELTQELSDGLKELSQKAGATLFMTLQAAFQILLHRYTTQDDIIVGTPIAGRTRAELEDLIGFFVNMLPLRTDMDGNPRFRELLARVKEVALEAYANQDISFEKLVEELQPRRDLSRNPIFQVFFALQNVPPSRWQLPSLEIAYLAVDNQTTRFDLALRLMETPAGLKGAFEYNTDLFEAETIARIARHFQHLLAGLSADPEQPINQIALIESSEREQLLREWNRTEQPYESNATVHELFAVQVQRTPKAIAVVYEQEQISYEELNRKANQLAHYLRRRGTSLEMPIGILMDRSIEMMVSVLAILKAGAAYVPLDPSYPRERLRLMVEDAELSLVIRRYRSGEWLEETGVAMVDVALDWDQIARENADEFESEATGENLAYVIYTSGSTGRPKGVMIPHRALINFLRSTSRQPGLTEHDVLLAVTTLSFDIAALELFLPLINGGRVVIVSREVAVDGQRLREKLVESGATVMQATPSSWSLLLEAGWMGDRQVKILCGGEALAGPLANQLIERGSEAWNMYGPTETTVWSTLYRVAKPSISNSIVSIGRPLANTEIYILDSNMQVLPIGVAGELYIGGAGLARGYWRAAGSTAERFVPDPFSGRPGARLYRTGDVARYLSDGNVQYVGRADQQVKVRGYRIELEEIEAVLNEQPQVHESVVVIRESETGDKRLVGYVVLEREAEFQVAEIRRHLRERLPEYMIPAALVKIEKLPLTPNGKVDRKMLPAPGSMRPDLEETFIAPRTAVEELVAGLWATVLDLEQVSINDNFFVLGGHSLLVTRVLARVQDIFGVNLQLRSLFEAPTLSEFARCIEEAQTKESRGGMPPLRRLQRAGRAPLTFAQQRLWFLNQLEPDSTAYNLATALSIKGSLNVPALEQSLSQLIRRHETLRTTFRVEDDEPVQVIADELQMRLVVEDLSHFAENEREAEALKLASEEARRGFDLSNGPLLRVRLLRLSEQDHALLLTMHHIISDGWSMALMVRELGVLHQANSGREEADSKELPIQYGDYAIWQQQWLSGAELDRQLAFWEQQLAGANYVLELPTDRQRPALQSHHGATYTQLLSAQLTEKLTALSQHENSTLFMTLLAAFRTLLYRYTSQPNILIGIPIANRTHTEIENLIGYFANTLVLRTDVAEEMSFRELLMRVRDVALGAFAHQDVPFEKLVEKLRPGRDLTRNPLFQVFFGLQNVDVPSVELQELTLSTLDLEVKATRFDLALGISPAEKTLRSVYEYSTDLFESETIARMAGHFAQLLEGIVVDPERRLFEFSLLSQAEHDQLISGWNPPHTDYEPRCIHKLFEAQASRTPEAIALRCEQQELSYRELNRRANQLAHYLRARGVKAESPVVICLERSLDLIVSLFAVLKAGGAYVPVDPAYPPQRLRLILEDAGAAALIAEEEVLVRLNNAGGAGSIQTICLACEWEAISHEAEEAVASGVDAENLAYVIYTSGSTGQPKGVQVTHLNLVSLLEAKGTLFPFTEHDVWTVFHSFTFDLSVWEIFAPLVYGSRLIIVPLRIAQSPEAFYDLLRREQVTILHQTPSLIAHLLRFTREAAVDVTWDLKLRLIVCGGEALPFELAAQLLSWQVPVWNSYGPTEATVWATSHQVDAKDLKDVSASIGRPLPNSETFILDSKQNLLPIGIVGELCVGGSGVARAYLNAPSETAEKFIPHPFSTRPGARLYRTGDLARYLPNGQIRYLGRADQQVKLTGYRIELGEIEAALARHPFVKECVVAADETVDDKKRLVCYVTKKEGAEELTFAGMREYLEQRLPWYMLPAAMVKLERMPLTRSGKVDRRALQALEVVDTSATQPYVEPRNLDEALLAGIWANVLGLERVGVNDNFFELGGHSLLSPAIVSKVKDIFDAELPVRILFEAPTVAAMAKRIKRQARIEAATPFWSPLVAIQPSGSKRSFFCVHPGGGGVSCYRDLSRFLGMDQPFYGLQAAEVSEDGGDYTYQSLEETAAEYTKAVREAQPEGPYLIGGWSAGGVIAFEMAQQLKRMGQEVGLLALLDSMPRSVGKGKADDGALAFLVAREIATNSKKSLAVSFDDLQKLTPDDQVGYLLDQLKQASALPREMEASWFRRILHGIWTRNENLDRYKLQVYSGRITLFRGSEIDPDFIKAQNALDYMEIDAFDPTNGWSRFSTEPIEVHQVPGHHYTIVREPHVRILAEKLGACLARFG